MHGLRRGRRAPRPQRAGSVHGDLAVAAKRIYLALVDGDVAVWADAAADVWFAPADEFPAIADASAVGFYRMGASASDIEEDLIELRRSRSTDAILY